MSSFVDLEKLGLTRGLNNKEQSSESESEKEETKIKKPMLISDLDVKNLYKSEIEDDEIFMKCFEKQTQAFNKKENQNLGRFYSPMLLQTQNKFENEK
jgi:hypothetical protein